MLHKGWMLFFSSALETSFGTEPFLWLYRRVRGGQGTPKEFPTPPPSWVLSSARHLPFDGFSNTCRGSFAVSSGYSMPLSGDCPTTPIAPNSSKSFQNLSELDLVSDRSALQQVLHLSPGKAWTFCGCFKPVLEMVSTLHAWESLPLITQSPILQSHMIILSAKLCLFR